VASGDAQITGLNPVAMLYVVVRNRAFENFTPTLAGWSKDVIYANMIRPIRISF